jgi:DNA-binding CsgD family transcriptional regulator
MIPNNLTPRELEVIKLVMEGDTGKEIAEKLGIEDHTVAQHKQNIIEKTGARRIIHAVCLIHGLVERKKKS